MKGMGKFEKQNTTQTVFQIHLAEIIQWSLITIIAK